MNIADRSKEIVLSVDEIVKKMHGVTMEFEWLNESGAISEMTYNQLQPIVDAETKLREATATREISFNKLLKMYFFSKYDYDKDAED